MFATNKKDTRCEILACRVALEYGLKHSPCSIEWIDVHYKCSDTYLVWMSMHYIGMGASINTHKIALQKQSI